MDGLMDLEQEQELIQKVRNKERLSQKEGEALYDLDLYTLGELADEIRTEKYGKKYTDHQIEEIREMVIHFDEEGIKRVVHQALVNPAPHLFGAERGLAPGREQGLELRVGQVEKVGFGHLGHGG